MPVFRDESRLRLSRSESELLPSQPAEPFYAFGNHFVAGGVADAEVGILSAENGTRDDEDVIFDSLGDKGGCITTGGGDKGVKSTFGPIEFEVVFEAIINQIAFAAVKVYLVGHVGL